MKKISCDTCEHSYGQFYCKKDSNKCFYEEKGGSKSNDYLDIKYSLWEPKK